MNKWVYIIIVFIISFCNFIRLNIHESEIDLLQGQIEAFEKKQSAMEYSKWDDIVKKHNEKYGLKES